MDVQGGNRGGYSVWIGHAPSNITQYAVLVGRRVEDGEVGQRQRRVGEYVYVDAVIGNLNRPHQPVCRDPRIVRVDLSSWLATRANWKQIQSYESKGANVSLPIRSNVGALHKAVV